MLEELTSDSKLSLQRTWPPLAFDVAERNKSCDWLGAASDDDLFTSGSFFD
jgi:hypothetical protein